MLYLLLSFGLLIAVYGPSLWVKFVMRKHSKALDNMPGTGSELAKHLLTKLELASVDVVEGDVDQNYFDPSNNVVSLSPDVHNEKSLTALAVAAHEVGHALQYHQKDRLMLLRTNWLPKIHRIEKIAAIGLAVVPLLGAATRIPAVIAITIMLLVIIMLSRIFFHLLTLPLEWDASFGKALPILETGYLPAVYNEPVRQVLKAAALTYVAAALADLLSFWRWIRFLR